MLAMEPSILLLFLLAVITQPGSADVKGPPKIDRNGLKRYLKATVGSVVRIRCPVMGNPPPLSQWRKDGEDINWFWERFKKREAGLRIEDVITEDSGQYVCIATNGFGSTSINFTLTVVEAIETSTSNTSILPSAEPDPGEPVPPSFSLPDKMVKRNLMRPMKSVVRLRCKANGNPKPEIDWYKDGTKMTKDQLGLEEGAKRAWVLKLLDIREEDSGEYTCVVYNEHGQINATYMLQVIETLSEKPVISGEHPVNTTVAYGGTTSFQCRVKSDVKPHIQWLKRVDPHNAALYENATIKLHGQRYAVLPAGEALSRPDGMYMNKLVIPHATEEDAGMYICLGANTIGFRYKSAFLEVLPNPVDGVVPEENVSELGEHVISQQVKMILIVTIPLTIALLFVIMVLACTYNLNRSQNQANNQSHSHSSLPRTCPVPKKDYESEYKQNINYHHNFSRTNGVTGGSSLYMGPEPSESEHSALTCSHSNLRSEGYKTSSDKVFGRYMDFPYNPPSLYSDMTLNSHRSMPNGGRGYSRSNINQHHLVTC